MNLLSIEFWSYSKSLAWFKRGTPLSNLRRSCHHTTNYTIPSTFFSIEDFRFFVLGSHLTINFSGRVDKHELELVVSGVV